jgi:cytochrome P450
MTERTFNPFDAGQVQDAWPLLQELRAEAPVARIGEGMYYVTRYAECRQVLKDFENFSNAAGFRAPGVEVPLEDRMLGEQDAPQHPFVRKVTVSALNIAVVRREEPFIRESARDLLAALPVEGEADLVPSFTVPLPNSVTVHMLGFPMDDADRIAAWSKQVMESEWPAMNRTEHGAGFTGAFPGYAAYIDERIAKLRAGIEAGQAGDDLISRLMQVEVSGRKLPDRQVRALTYNLLLGGLTTTSQLLGNLIYQLLTIEGLAQAVRQRQDGIERLVEESLRIAPPVLFTPRGCVRDTMVGDAPVRAGERVIVGTASANRDEQVFPDSDTLSLDRDNSDRHVSFGFGPHLCVGAALARAVARIGIREFLERFPEGSLRLAQGYTYENVPTYFEYGPTSLPVQVGQNQA